MSDKIAPYLHEVDKGLQLIPEQATNYAGQVDHLYFALVAASAIILLLVIGLIAAFGFHYRAGNDKADRSNLPSTRTENKVEIAVLGAMLVAFMAFFGWGATLYLDAYRGPDSAMTIEIVGKQWMWKIQHPDGTREINTLHIPVDEVIELQVSSQDVIHSFFVPAFRLKRDVVPGKEQKAWFKASKTGEYRFFCAEYCGSFHSRMLGKVVVMERGAYQAWLTRQGTDGSLAAAGKELFEAHGCSGCHMGKSSVRAPSLDGIYGRSVALSDERVILADEAYIRDSILHPEKHIVAGYAPIMPSFAGQITEDELLRIIAYIKSLEPGDWVQGTVPQSEGESP